MIKATVIALLLVLQDSQATTSWGSKSKSKHEFIKKMRLSQKMHGKIPRKLSHDNLLAKSVHKPGLRANPSEPASKTTGTTKDPSAVTETSTQETDNRHLYASSFWPWKTSNNNNASDYDAATDEIEDGMNETDVTDNSRTSWWTWNGWGNNKSGNATDENDMWESENQTSSILETLADFSIKYAGCMALTSIADQDEEGSNFVNQNFVTYRLCPADSCEDDSWTGCKTTYGEYLMSLEDFLTVQQDYVDEEFKYYCDYCEKCVYYQTWFTNYTADGEISNTTGCAHYTECLNAADECSEEAQEEREEEGGYMLENFLECQEIEFDYYASDQDESDFNETASGYYFEDWSNTEYELNGKAYIGSHCNAGVIEIGLFADESCINYVGNQINFANVSVYEEQAQAIQEMYVPEGCLRCDGDNVSKLLACPVYLFTIHALLITQVFTLSFHRSSCLTFGSPKMRKQLNNTNKNSITKRYMYPKSATTCIPSLQSATPISPRTTPWHLSSPSPSFSTRMLHATSLKKLPRGTSMSWALSTVVKQVLVVGLPSVQMLIMRRALSLRFKLLLSPLLRLQLQQWPVWLCP